MKKTKGYTAAEQKKLKELLFEKTGYHIRSNALLEQIFTRSTYSYTNGGENNEVLEFIGDQVLSYYLIKVLSEVCGGWSYIGEYAFRFREHHLTTIKQKIVCNDTLCKIIDSWGVAKYVIAGASDWPDELNDQPKVRADLFEAILGAIALESKWDSAVLDKAVRQMLDIDTLIADVIRDICEKEAVFSLNNAVRLLKELADTGHCTLPKYEYEGPDTLGYDEKGDPNWTCTCTIGCGENQIRNKVWSINKGDAKKAAAYLTLCAQGGVANVYGPESKSDTWHWQDGELVPGEPVQ